MLFLILSMWKVERLRFMWLVVDMLKVLLVLMKFLVVLRVL